MGLVTKNKTWADNENVTFTDLNGTFDTLYGVVNGNIDNNNVKTAAAIAEAKIAYNTAAGHNHDGINSKLIPATLVWTVVGTLTVSADPAPWIYVNSARNATKAIAVVKTAPTGATAIIDIEYSTDNGGTWTSLWSSNTANRPTIAISAKEATQASFDTTAIPAGAYVRVAVDQVGSTVSGADLQVFLVA